MNKALHHPNTIRVRIWNQNKRRTPKATRSQSPQLGTTTNQLERNNTKDKIFIELLLSLVASSARTHRHLQTSFGSICESQGLSNLAPSRSRLFKLMGKVTGMRWSCSKRLAYMVANIFAKESKKRRQSTNEEL